MLVFVVTVVNFVLYYSIKINIRKLTHSVVCRFHIYVHVPHLEQDLQDSIYHAHASAHESKERHNKLNKVITYGLKTMEPPRGVVQKV